MKRTLEPPAHLRADQPQRPSLGRRDWALLAAMIAVAVCARLYRLGDLSLAGDEETTALAALALLEGWPPILPGGTSYLRALPFTVLEAISVKVAGPSEFSLRLVSVLAAGVRVAGTFWLARWFLPRPGAFCVAALLAISPLDLEYSRNARMYSLFSAFDVLFLASVVRLASLGRGAWLAVVTGLATVLTHRVGVLHAIAPLVSIAARGLRIRTGASLFVVGVAMLLAYALYEDFSDAGYGTMGVIEGVVTRSSPLSSHIESAQLAIGPATSKAVLVVLSLAATLCMVIATKQCPSVAKLAAGLVLGAGVAASPVFAGVLLIGALILARASPLKPSRSVGLMLASIGLTVAAWGISGLIAGQSLEWVGRFLLGFPAPNWVDFVVSMPLLSLFGLLGLLLACHRACRTDHPVIWLILIAAALAPGVLSGLDRRIEGLRFHLHALPPLLILAVLGVSEIVRRVRPMRPARAVVFAALAVAASVRPDLSFEVLTREHGRVRNFASQLGVAPDHRGPGEFVRERLVEGDLVAAEDMLQQHYYVGRVDYWMRRVDDAGSFLVEDPTTGVLRDGYVGAELLSDTDALRKASQRATGGVWLITSGEAEVQPSVYRTLKTRDTLDAWASQALFVGADGLTRVHYLVRGELESAPAP